MNKQAIVNKPQIEVTRRDFIGTVAAIGATAAMAPRAASAADLPGRGEFVIRDAHVLTMDPGIDDLDRGDIYVQNGTVVAVGS